MSPITHFLSGWLLANTVPMERRDRALVTLSAVVPDVDGLGIVAEILTRGSKHPLLWWSDYHHVLHNVGFAVACAGLAFAIGKRRGKTALLVFAGFHLHLAGDLIGARGPDGDQWPMPYLLPFSDAWQLTWSGQWALNAWPNFLITGVALAATFVLAYIRGHSPLELISIRADSAFVRTVRNRFRGRA
ncbi:MAG: metal-dependent hydrolase [Candidatus Hydrogenedentes bacterium]|nr:metal-dependent hydrolase [Candidatus Hydrogenedentota bacterium]